MRRIWIDCTARRRCPVCGSDSWCQVSRTGDIVLCKRHTSGRERVNDHGVPYWIHVLTAATATAWQSPLPPSIDRAPIDVLDTAYRVVLSALSLSDAHREGLRRRGLNDEHIHRGGYCTLRTDGRAKIARAIVDAVGEGSALGVPGICRKGEGERSWLSFAGSAGLVVPCRTATGLIGALKVRSDDGEHGKYLYVSSAKWDGPSADCLVHVPAGTKPGGDVVITEGELKADVASAIMDATVISVPGTGSWSRVLDVLPLLSPARVLVAFDADAATNPHVARAQRECLQGLRRAGYRAGILSWDLSEGKGIDDVLRSRMELQRAG